MAAKQNLIAVGQALGNHRGDLQIDFLRPINLAGPRVVGGAGQIHRVGSGGAIAEHLAKQVLRAKQAVDPGCLDIAAGAGGAVGKPGTVADRHHDSQNIAHPGRPLVLEEGARTGFPQGIRVGFSGGHRRHRHADRFIGRIFPWVLDGGYGWRFANIRDAFQRAAGTEGSEQGQRQNFPAGASRHTDEHLVSPKKTVDRTTTGRPVNSSGGSPRRRRRSPSPQ